MSDLSSQQTNKDLLASETTCKEGEGDEKGASSSDISGDMMGSRLIRVNTENKISKNICCKYCFVKANYQIYKSNVVSTGKYNLITFLPRNL